MTTPSTPFTAQLRARPDTIRLATNGEPVVTIRVQVPEVWDTVRVDAAPNSSVLALKERALAELMPDVSEPDSFVMKLAGWEVLDESISLAEAGAMNGSIFLLTSRRRHPVR